MIPIAKTPDAQSYLWKVEETWEQRANLFKLGSVHWFHENSKIQPFSRDFCSRVSRLVRTWAWVQAHQDVGVQLQNVYGILFNERGYILSGLLMHGLLETWLWVRLGGMVS